MCYGLAIPRDDAPDDLLDADGFGQRTHTRGGHELRFLWRHRPCLLPVMLNGRLKAVRWGTPHRGRGYRLPPGGWTWEATVEAGGWGDSGAEPVDVPASFIWAGGVWPGSATGAGG